MLRRAIDAEVRRRLVRPMDLRAHAAVGRLQRAVRQPRPIAPHVVVEGLGSGRIDGVVDVLGPRGVQPLGIRAESRLAAEVQRQVHAQPRVLRQRIHEPCERCLALKGEVAALAETRGRRRWKALDARGDEGRMQTRRIDHDPRAEFHLRRRHDVRAAVAPHRGHRGPESDRAAMALEVALQREHPAVAVHDAGRRRQQGRLAAQLGLERDRFLARQPSQVVHAIEGRLGLQRVQAGQLLRRGRDDQLAAAPVRDMALLAMCIEQLLAAHAQARLQRSGRVVQAGVDDLAVARAHPGADRVRAFQHQRFQPAHRQRAPYRQADNPGTDHDSIDSIHARDCAEPRPRRAARLPPRAQGASGSHQEYIGSRPGAHARRSASA